MAETKTLNTFNSLYIYLTKISKTINLRFAVFVLSILVLCSNLNAQYDTGTLIYSQTSSTNLTSISKNYIIEDFDGDFNADIIMVKANNNNNQLTWYKGDGNGNFSPQTNLLTIENGYEENEIFYVDMNEDNIKDIIFQNSYIGFTILLNDGQANISAQINNQLVATDLYEAYLKGIADIDGDGDQDVLFRGKISNTTEGIFRENCLIGYNDGSGNYPTYTFLNNDETEIVLLIETGDIDGDGDLDIIYSGNENIQRAGGFGPVYYVDSYIRIYENLGANGLAFKAAIDIPEVNNAEPAFTHIKVQDVNSDGTDELLIEYAIWDECVDDLHLHDCIFFYQFHIMDYQVQSEVFATLEVYNSWLHGYVLSEFNFSTEEFYYNPFLIQFGYQNSDNNLDILSVNVPQGRLQWYLGNGNGNFNNTKIVNINNQYSSISPTLKVADIDNDTDLDVFVLLNDDTSSNLTVFQNLELTSSCVPVLDLANTSLTDGVYQAGTTIISSGNVIAGNNNVILKAGDNVTLKSGFRVPLNSTVKVYIDECN